VTEDAVFTALRDAVLRTVPGVTEDDITPEATLKELGANSIDRMDILLDVKEALGGTLSVRDLSSAKDVATLVRVLRERCEQLA
jgi:polyketide biosynthesis acyl carrier protein